MEVTGLGLRTGRAGEQEGQPVSLENELLNRLVKILTFG